MTVETAEDLAGFFADFGVQATWTHDGAAASVTGIFDSPTLVRSGVGEVEGISAAPSFLCAAADLPDGASQGDALEIAGSSYVVRAFLPDGTGVVRTELEALK